MLKVTDNGVSVTLNGKSVRSGNGVFWFAFALLIGAVAVAMGMSFLPRQLAILALLLLVVGSFIFNRMRQKQQQQTGVYINSGVVEATRGVLIYEGTRGSQRIRIKETDRIENHGSQLTVYDAKNQRKCHISGFEEVKEVDVMQKVLLGKTLSKRNAHIKMQP